MMLHLVPVTNCTFQERVKILSVNDISEMKNTYQLCKQNQYNGHLYGNYPYNYNPKSYISDWNHNLPTIREA